MPECYLRVNREAYAPVSPEGAGGALGVGGESEPKTFGYRLGRGACNCTLLPGVGCVGFDSPVRTATEVSGGAVAAVDVAASGCGPVGAGGSLAAAAIVAR